MKNETQTKKYFNKRGFALFMAVVVVGVLSTVSLGIINITVKGLILSSIARESQSAFYAADAGAECALYWDLKQVGISAFYPNSEEYDLDFNPFIIDCNGQVIFSSSQTAGPGLYFYNSVIGGANKSVFQLNFPDESCAIVEVDKEDADVTKIISRGYNTCNVENRNRVERAIEINY